MRQGIRGMRRDPVLAGIDHYTEESVGIHSVKKATRFEALEPIRQGLNEYSAALGRRLCSSKPTMARQ